MIHTFPVRAVYWREHIGFIICSDQLIEEERKAIIKGGKSTSGQKIEWTNRSAVDAYNYHTVTFLGLGSSRGQMGVAPVIW